MDEQFYIDQLTTKKDNMIYLNGGTGTQSIMGFLDGPTTLSASANWGDGMAGADGANNITNNYNSVAGAVGMKAIKSIYSTIQTWQSSAFNAMSFSIFVVANRPGENPLDTANKIWDYVLPSTSWMGPGVVSTPGGYSTSALGFFGNSGQVGQVSLKIGNWFHAPEAWLVSMATVEVSKQRVKSSGSSSGHPIYAKIDMVLNPSRMFTAEEVKDWIKVRPNNTNIF